MTSQLALMNNFGIALASDSTVTIGEKTYDSVKKIFTLGGEQPIGFMIAGSANYLPCNVAWERVISLFSHDIGESTYPTLEEYVISFKKFVSESENLAPNVENSTIIQADLIGFLELYIRPQYKEQLDAVVRNISGDIYEEFPGLDEHISKTINQRIDIIHDMIGPLDESLDEEKKYTHHRILQFHEETIKNAAAYFCKRHEISTRSAKKKIREIMSYHLAENSALEHVTNWRESTNLVIAGFGTEQLTPELIELRVGAIVDEEEGAFIIGDHHRIRRRTDLTDKGDLIWDENDRKQISAAAFILPYGQHDEIQNILNGLHDDFITQYLEGPMTGYIRNEVLDYLIEQLGQIDGVGPATRTKIVKCFKNCCDDLDKKITKEVRDATDHYRTSRRGNFRTSTKSMSAAQLAEFAKKLVAMEAEITYYSKSKRTVGGHILVATITKEDGFRIRN